MRKIAPLGKKSYTGKKFKSAGPNELNASDKNYIRNNINLFNIQLLASKVGKPVAAVEKFIKKEKLVSTIEVQEVNELVMPKVSEEKQDKVELVKQKKADKLIIKPSISVEVLPSKHDKVESAKQKKADKLIIKPSVSVEVLPSKLDKVESLKQKKTDKLIIKPSISIEVLPSKHDKVESAKQKKTGIRKRSKIVAPKIDFIRENHQKYTAIEMAKELNVSITTLRYHLKNLNLKPSKAVKIPSEIIQGREKFIKENHKNYTVRELSEQLNCSCDIVRLALRKLKIKALRVTLSKEIPPQVINFIKVSYRTMTAREMSDALGNISWTQIKYLCEKYGFLKTPEETTAIRHRWNRSEFTVSEEKYIIMNHGVIPLSEIAQHLGRTRSSIIQHLSRKGLKITKEQHDALNRKNFEKARLVFQEKK
jgi:predicted transcriptional regulator